MILELVDRSLIKILEEDTWCAIKTLHHCASCHNQLCIENQDENENLKRKVIEAKTLNKNTCVCNSCWL